MRPSDTDDTSLSDLLSILSDFRNHKRSHGGPNESPLRLLPLLDFDKILAKYALGLQSNAGGYELRMATIAINYFILDIRPCFEFEHCVPLYSEIIRMYPSG